MNSGDSSGSTRLLHCSLPRNPDLSWGSRESPSPPRSASPQGPYIASEDSRSRSICGNRRARTGERGSTGNSCRSSTGPKAGSASMTWNRIRGHGEPPRTTACISTFRVGPSMSSPPTVNRERVDTLSCPQGTRDDVLLGLARFILPWLGDQAQMCDLTFDYFALMFCSHIVATYGKVRVPARRVGGLAPWQRRRVLEIVDAGFDQPLRLSTFAEACGLSLSYFNRAFKQSFGVPAHRFVTQRRVDLAKSLMMNSSMSLAEIALRSGFCDQPAFSRTFAAVVGKSPKRWLNEYRVGHASCDG